MTIEERIRFLDKIKEEVKNDPSLIADINNACNAGILSKIKVLEQQAADVETIALAAFSISGERYRKSNSQWIRQLISSKVAKWADSLFFDWRSILDEKNKKEEVK